jgi:DNA mismatch endonuclease Vsr
MRGNRRVGTRPELLLQSELGRRGLRYTANVERLPGKPDLVIETAKVAVFCDGDFWQRPKLGTPACSTRPARQFKLLDRQDRSQPSP